VKPRPASGPRAFFALSAALGALALAWLYGQDYAQRLGFDIDAFHHLASVRELAKGEFPPAHNLVPGHTPQGHYGPYLVLLGWLARVLAAPPATVLAVAGVANLILHALLLRAVVVRLAGEGAGRWAALAPLLLWGPWPSLPSIGWPSLAWPGTTSLADAQNFYYPNEAGIVLALAIVALLLAPPGSALVIGARRGGLALFLSGLLIATHPLSGLLLLAALAALGADWLLARAASARALAWLAALPAGGLALAALWPYYPVLGLLPAFGIAWFRTGSQSLPARVSGAALPELLTPAPPPVSMPILSIIGPGVVGIPGLVQLARRGRSFPLLWFLACLGVWLCPLVPMRHRFVFFAAIPLHIGACAFLELLWVSGRRIARTAAVLILLSGAASAAMRIAWVLDCEIQSVAFVAALTPPDAVILAKPGLSNGIAGMTGRKVVCPRNPDVFLILAGGARRIMDVGRFFAGATAAETRTAILRRWGVTHVLVDRLRTLPLALPYPIVYEGEGYVLYDVRSITKQ
jgi:hypothetical protein